MFCNDIFSLALHVVLCKPCSCCMVSGLICLQNPATGSTGAADGVCNEFLPNDSVYSRFLYVVHSLAANGFYVVIDNHLRCLG